MPECGSQVILCDLPVRFDTYEGCSHNCSYCFARKKQDMGDIRPHESASTLQKFIDGKLRRGELRWIDWRIPLHWGGMSDPFQPIEERLHISKACLTVFAETQYPFVFSTKGRLAATTEYTDLFRLCNVVGQVSMVSARYDRFETGAPPFHERLDMLPKLADSCKRLIVRVQPYMLGMAADIIAAIPEYKARGVYGLVMEGLKSFTAFRGSIRIGGDNCYPTSALKHDFSLIREKCYAVGLKFFSGENRLRFMGDSRCCCGVEGLEGFAANHANLNYLRDGIQYTAKMKEPKTGEAFRTLAQETETGNIAIGNSYETNMEIAARTEPFLKAMGYISEEG